MVASTIGTAVDAYVSFASDEGQAPGQKENTLLFAALAGHGATVLRTIGTPGLFKGFHGEHACHSIGAIYGMSAVAIATLWKEPTTRELLKAAALGNDFCWSAGAIGFGKRLSTTSSGRQADMTLLAVHDMVKGGDHH